MGGKQRGELRAQSADRGGIGGANNGRVSQDEPQQLSVRQPERSGRFVVGQEAIALAPDERQGHLEPNDVEIGLELAFRERESIGEDSAATPGMKGDELDNGPDAAEAIRDEPFSLHRRLSRPRPRGQEGRIAGVRPGTNGTASDRSHRYSGELVREAGLEPATSTSAG